MEIKKEKEDIVLNYCIVKEEPPYPVSQNLTDEKASLVRVKTETPSYDTSETSQFVISEIEEKGHKCPLCDKIFKKAYVLKSHIQLHSAERNFCCTICSSSFKTQANLNRHEKTHINEYRPCRICEKTFKNKRTLTIHLRTHKYADPERKDIKCDQCDRIFITNGSLRRHMVLVHNAIDFQDPSKSAFTCKECGKMHWDKATLIRHKLVHSQVKNIECSVCSKKFKHQMYLDRHMDRHKTNRPYTCSICNMSFKRRENLYAHNIVHTDEPKTCPYCNETFRNRLTLRGHIKQIHRGLPVVTEDGPIMCLICKVISENLEALKEHVKIHTEDGDFECDLCGKRFKRKSNTREHILSVHLNQKRKRQNRKYRPPAVRKYTCPHCDKKLQTRSHYMTHLTVHTNDRPYQCTFCPSKFKTKDSLKKHMQRETCKKNQEPLPISTVAIKTEMEDTETLETEIEVSETVKSEMDCSIEIKSEFE